MRKKLELQPASLDIYDTKYRLKNEAGENIDADINATFDRVATALSAVEPEATRAATHKDFVWALANGAIPAGRITSNAGAGDHKSNASLINCVLSGTIEDSIDGIFKSLRESAQSLAVGNGIGYEFSTIRPNGAFVSGAGAATGGALDFMDCFDVMCARISSAGGRRGAQMGTFDIRHPEVVDFISAKREDGRLRKFNLSVLITDDFIQAVKDEAEWFFSFPITVNRYNADDDYIWRDFPVTDNYVTNTDGLVACERYGSMPATELWNLIMQSTFDYAEPGFILIDRMNQLNPLTDAENFRASNPCGEVPLPPYGACLLGSINLVEFVTDPFTDQANFDYARFTSVVRVFHRMLDNVVEVNGLKLPEQIEEITNKRRHGMGFLGLGSALVLLGIDYGSKESLEFTDSVTKSLALTGYRVGMELAKEKGRAPIFEDPKVLKDFVNSEYMTRIFSEDPNLRDEILEHGCRYTHCTSIAPTGTIALSLGNNVSNGIEPSFSHQYSRNIIRVDRATKEKVTVYSYESLLYNEIQGREVPIAELPPIFRDSSEITPKEHVDVQAAAQYWIDSSISKTLNVPTDYPFEDFKDIYLYGIDQGLKGLATFRFNPEAFQGVLVREEDLEATQYVFVLEDGSEVVVRGSDTIAYDGAEHSAANLFDALKEGTYNKY